ncbi:MAG: SDR family NAD(P)-dependent oxidoreductase [Flavobacteriales bacterium]|nr:SDR family NAD(P)-dependent oxidoreductase [Flavobacteriales bacterium]
MEIFQCDISDQKQCLHLVNWIQENHSKLNILVNNAAIVHISQFLDDDDIIKKAEIEINTNFISPIRLIKLLSPIIQKNKNPTLINITTGLIYVPRSVYPFYNSTKAALHSFTQILRLQLSKTKFKVIEVMFPAVKTPWHNGTPPKIAITPEKAVDEMIKGLENGKTEIKVAKAKLLYLISRIAPKFALKKINSLEDE